MMFSFLLDLVSDDTSSANDLSYVEPAGYLHSHQSVPSGLLHSYVQELARES